MDFQLPELGEGVYEADLVQWMVAPGDTIRRGDTLLEVMTDKATMEVPSPFAGTISQILREPGSKVKVGETILSYDPTSKGNNAQSQKGELGSRAGNAQELGARSSKTTAKPPVTGVSTVLTTRELPVAAPSVRYLARKLGIDLATVPGSGPAGRILLEDLAPYLEKSASKSSSTADRPRKTIPVHDFGVAGTRAKMPPMRKTIAKHLSESQQRIPFYAYIDECDITQLVQIRHSLKQSSARMGIKLTYLPFMVRAVALALRDLPIVNSSIDDEKQEIVYHAERNVGIAVATPNGLMVPVIRTADHLDLFAIAREIERLAMACRTGQVKREELLGGTFTITSIGNIGGLISTPIINYPEAGIMGIGKTVRRPVYNERNEIQPADLVYLSFTFDHRLIDGAVGAMFGNHVKNALENPATLLLPPTVKATK
ncbi:MAG: dihydrolipoamide acetyltransferase family protein [Zavarzinella sp.]